MTLQAKIHPVSIEIKGQGASDNLTHKYCDMDNRMGIVDKTKKINSTIVVVLHIKFWRIK